MFLRVPVWLDGLGSGVCKLQKKGALDPQPQVIQFTSCLSMVGGSLRVLRLLPQYC